MSVNYDKSAYVQIRNAVTCVDVGARRKANAEAVLGLQRTCFMPSRDMIAVDGNGQAYRRILFACMRIVQLHHKAES